MPHPGMPPILGMFPAVHVDFTKVVASFVEHDGFASRRDHLERVIGEQDAGHAERIARFDERVGVLLAHDRLAKAAAEIMPFLVSADFEIGPVMTP